MDFFLQIKNDNNSPISLDVGVIMDGQEQEVPQEEVESLPGLCFRIVATPRDEESMLLFLQCHPRSLNALTEDVQARNISMDSFSIPVINLNNGDKGATQLPLFPLEDPVQSCGLSVRPFLLAPGAGQVKLPPVREIKNEIASLMRSSPLPVHTREVGTVFEVATTDTEWPVSARELTRLWPEPAPQLGTGNDHVYYASLSHVDHHLCRSKDKAK